MRSLVDAAVALLFGAAAAAAQRPLPTDTFGLEPVVVTAERARTPLVASVAAVSTITADELRRFAAVTVADALRQVPGFALVNFDGLGGDPQVMVRGFYGAGEAEYVVVLIDGRPVNQLQSGVVAWDALPLDRVQAIEVVRGASSALYGDAAIGGIINIITRSGSREHLDLQAAGGQYGTWRGDAHVRLGSLALSGGASTTDGARAHSQRSMIRLSGALPLVQRDDATVRLTVRSHRRAYDEPGPLLESLMREQRLGSDPLFRFDNTRDDTHALSLDGVHTFGNRVAMSGTFAGELRGAEIVRTLALAPGFGDTKQRELQTTRALANAQLQIADVAVRGDRLVAGADVTAGTLESRYYRVLTGPRAAYQHASGERGELDASGSGSRAAAGVFADYSVQPVDPLRFSLGARLDHIRDRFEAGDDNATAATHTALSPKLGANLQLLQGTNVYASVGRSFKAPTLDQLYDQRSFPIPFPPFSVTTSNTGLEPSFGTHYEAGLLHAHRVRAAHTALSLAAYQMDMQDELDFNVQKLRYENIGRSRHRGIEAGLQMRIAAASGFVNYTMQAPTARSGDNSGNYLKNIPRHVVNAGASSPPLFGTIRAAASLTHARGAYIDDANTRKLEAYTRMDAQLSCTLGGFVLFAEVRNLFDAEYSTVAFFDPAGTGEVYYYPAAGRAIELGVRTGR